MRLCLAFVLLIGAFQSAVSARAQDSPIITDTKEAACEVLKKRIGEGLPSGKPDNYWYCDYLGIKNELVYVMALRSSRPRNDGSTIYSNLVGWFAVARRSDLVVEYDINEDRLVRLSQAYFERK
jgi:hypothetical protein